jgi:hypothetical protein
MMKATLMVRYPENATGSVVCAAKQRQSVIEYCVAPAESRRPRHLIDLLQWLAPRRDQIVVLLRNCQSLSASIALRQLAHDDAHNDLLDIPRVAIDVAHVTKLFLSASHLFGEDPLGERIHALPGFAQRLDRPGPAQALNRVISDDSWHTNARRQTFRASPHLPHRYAEATRCQHAEVHHGRSWE